MRKFVLPAIAVVALLAGCAGEQRMRTTWVPTGNPSMTRDQAKSECSFEVGKGMSNMDRLFLMTGLPMVDDFGDIQGLNSKGAQLYSFCMGARGYRQGPMVPY
jgi:hypothetical protein